MSEENKPSKKPSMWKNVSDTKAKPSFKELMQETKQKKEEEKKEYLLNGFDCEEDYLLALQLQQEYDKQTAEFVEEEPLTTQTIDEIDDDFALAMQLQEEEERLYEAERSKMQASTKLLISQPAVDNNLPTFYESSVDIEPEINEHYVGINSPYRGEDVNENGNAVLIGPTSSFSKHDPEYTGRSARLQHMIDNAGNIEEYNLNDKSIVKLRKYYGHKKDRTTKAPKENKVTTNSTISNQTRLLILKLINNGLFDSIVGHIHNGKEGTILSAVKGDLDDDYDDDYDDDNEWYCLKVYKAHSMEFKNKKEYIKDDYRFTDIDRASSSDIQLVYEWTRKEYHVLQKFTDALIPCPEPIYYENNVLVMTMIGSNGQPAPSLKEYLDMRPRSYFHLLMQCLHLLRYMKERCDVIHGDFSEYNLLVLRGIVYVIDVGQSVDHSHSKWLEFLQRDIHNILQFFNRKQAIQDIEEVEKVTLCYVMQQLDEVQFNMYIQAHCYFICLHTRLT